MAIDDTSAIRELQEAALELETERGKVAQRIATQEQTLGAIEHKLSSINEAIAVLRERHGLPRAGTEISDELRVKFEKLSPREMLIEYARMRGGQIIVREAASLFAEMGLFRDVENARGNFYTLIGRSIQRNERMFEQVRRGVYALTEEFVLDMEATKSAAIEATVSTVAPSPHEYTGEPVGPTGVGFIPQRHPVLDRVRPPRDVALVSARTHDHGSENVWRTWNRGR